MTLSKAFLFIKKIVLLSALEKQTLDKVYLIFSSNFFYCLYTVYIPTCSNLSQLSKCFLYLLDLARLIEFLRLIRI
jgi:hypothetical protein